MCHVLLVADPGTEEEYLKSGGQEKPVGPAPALSGATDNRNLVEPEIAS